MKIQNKELHRIDSTAIIYKEGKYSILKRSPDRKAFPNKWSVQGGGLEVKVKLDEDNIDYAWVSYQEAKKYDLVEGLLEEIAIVDKILKKESKSRL